MPGAMQSRDLWRVLVFAAAAKLSVHPACQQLARAPSGPTVLGTLAQQLSDLDGREGHANALLARLLPKGLGQRGRRSTLALGRVRAKQTMDHVGRTLLERWVMLGMRLKRLLLDRGFDSVRVRRALSMGELPCIMPAVNRGKKPTTPGGPTGTYALAAAKESQWTSYTWKSPQEGQVDFALAVVGHNTRGHRGRHQREALWYATWGVNHRPWSWMRATYRGRFGIESSSRQVPQARIRTRSRNPVWRLLFVGVALGLRHVWVWWHAEVLAEPQRGARQLRPESMRCARLLLWLLMAVAHHYRLLRNIPVYHDLYEKAQTFGIVFNY